MDNIGIGTAAVGRPLYINIRHNKSTRDFSLPAFKSDGLKLLQEAYANGIRFFDTSSGYGLAESLLENWLKGKTDPGIAVGTKWGIKYMANFDMNAQVHEQKEHSLELLNIQWDFSKNLLPFLKVYQIHSATMETGVLDNKSILERLYQIKNDNGIVIGISTTGINQVEVIQKAMDIEIGNEPLFGSFQSTFNVMEQSILQLKPAFLDKNMRLIMKESLANGRLIPNQIYKRHGELYRYLNDLSRKYDVGPDAIAIRFCIDSFPGAICLLGPSNPAHLHSNLKVNTFRLEEPEMEFLRGCNIEPESYWNERKKLRWQ
jgi:aryl-alcohol dehydrogenase-like predicted oxidoreductase